jgi:hypothetical protein
MSFRSFLREIVNVIRETKDQPSFFRPAKAQEPHSAQTWLARQSEREESAVWTQLGELTLPSGRIFVGDPTSGHDDHMQGARAAGVARLEAWTFQDRETSANHLIWLEAAGTVPVSKSQMLEFGVDAATIGLGDANTGDLFSALTDRELDAGRGDNFDWIMPHIQESQHFAKWLTIPPNDLHMLIASTANDGGYAAVWLHDTSGALSGILIDITGRTSDQLFLDKLLPDA